MPGATRPTYESWFRDRHAMKRSLMIDNIECMFYNVAIVTSDDLVLTRKLGGNIAASPTRSER
jgi:hypothetical protein